jgi:membrane protease YdiL (CAAX protease family)
MTLAEEVLWRGVYIHVFKDNKWLSILYAFIGFALWHYAPQVVFVNKRPGRAYSVVLFSFCLWLFYAYTADKQQNIF